MKDTATLIRDRLAAHLEPYGMVSEFARKTGIPRRNLDNWLSGTAIPLDAIDDIARGMDTTPWELLKPEGAQPTPSAAEAMAAAALSSPILRDILAIWPKLDDISQDALLLAATDLLKDQPSRAKSPKNDPRAQGTSRQKG